MACPFRFVTRAARVGALVVLLIVTGAPIVRTARGHDVGQQMVDGAVALLASLDEAQRDQAQFNFADDERSNWHFIPRQREGLSLKQMKPEQRQLAYGLLASALSHEGMVKSLQIMSLEQILHDMEDQSPRRDPLLYYVSIFGEPSNDTRWGWRVEGHHLSVNFTLVPDGAVAPTPSFFGSNPAEVLTGPRKGLRVLAAEEDLGRALVSSLTAGQRQTAIIDAEAPRDVINGPGRQAQLLDPPGLPAREMNKQQVALLRQLVKEYVVRLRPALAREEMQHIRQSGFRNLHFAWAGGLERGTGHYYRVQGPTFVLEYDNTQNDANHVHCVWRDLKNDFGIDLLKRHYEQSPHPQDKR